VIKLMKLIDAQTQKRIALKRNVKDS
jgi:hypothetical protein